MQVAYKLDKGRDFIYEPFHPAGIPPVSPGAEKHTSLAPGSTLR
jgi:hypothetical protein